MDESCPVTVLESFHISPPPGAVPTTSVPLSFFDISWFLSPPMQRLLFYEFPHTKDYFIENILPNLKNSLALALRHYFPLAGNLICPPLPQKPYILFTEGESSVSFTVAESMLDFDKVVVDHPTDVRELHPFVPKLPPVRLEEDGTCKVPLLALKVILFPNSGICIAAQFFHMVSDAISFGHFMKSWASVFKSEDYLTRLDPSSLPSHDRAGIEDPCGLESTFLKIWFSCSSTWDWEMNERTAQALLADKVRATFAIDKLHIERVRDLISNNSTKYPAGLHVSIFVATCSLIWVCLIKSKTNGLGNLCDDDKLCHLVFPSNCRQLLKPKLSTTYFGNCIARCYGSAKRGELLGENGILVAAEAIGKRLKELANDVFNGAEKWMSNWHEIGGSKENFKKMIDQGILTMVMGSPKVRNYETDFGWGKLKKNEVVQIDITGGLHISEHRNGQGGIEFSLALTRIQMDVFNTVFEQMLKQNAK